MSLGKDMNGSISRAHEIKVKKVLKEIKSYYLYQQIAHSFDSTTKTSKLDVFSLKQSFIEWSSVNLQIRIILTFINFLG